MSWTALVLVTFSGLAEGGMQSIMKLAPLHRFTLLAAGYLLAVPYYAAWIMLEGAGTTQSLFWLLVLLHVPLMVLGYAFLVQGLQLSPLTKVAPYLTFTPAWLLVTALPIAWLTGTGWPTMLGVVGVAVMTGGVYVQNIRAARVGFSAPFRELIADRGSRLVFLATVIFGLSASLDPFVLQYAKIQFYLLVDHGLVGIAFAGMAVAWRTTGRAKREEITPAGRWPLLALLGLSIAAAVVPYMLAIRLDVPVSYVVAVKQSWLILLMVGIGLLLGTLRHARVRHAGERKDLALRLPGVLLMVAGMVIVLLWGRVS